MLNEFSDRNRFLTKLNNIFRPASEFEIKVENATNRALGLKYSGFTDAEIIDDLQRSGFSRKKSERIMLLAEGKDMEWKEVGRLI